MTTMRDVAVLLISWSSALLISWGLRFWGDQHPAALQAPWAVVLAIVLLGRNHQSGGSDSGLRENGLFAWVASNDLISRGAADRARGKDLDEGDSLFGQLDRGVG